jgi:thymidylate kinase
VTALPRDVVIEFAGMPKSGKTTVLDIVSHRIRRAGCAVADFHGGGRYAPVGKSDLASLNLYLAASALQYVAAIGADERPPRIHLLDRGLNDRVIFSRALGSLGLISDSHVTAIEAIAGVRDVRQKIDACFVFTTSPELSLQRESANRLTTVHGRIMNTSRLQALHDAANSFAREQPPTAEGPLIVEVDTAGLDGQVQATARTVLETIASLLPPEVARTVESGS